MAMSGGNVLVTTGGGGRQATIPLAFSRQGSDAVLNILQSTGLPLTTINYLAPKCQ